MHTNTDEQTLITLQNQRCHVHDIGSLGNVVPSRRSV